MRSSDSCGIVYDGSIIDAIKIASATAAREIGIDHNIEISQSYLDRYSTVPIQTVLQNFFVGHQTRKLNYLHQAYKGELSSMLHAWGHEPRINITNILNSIIEAFQDIKYITELKQRWSEIKKLQSIHSLAY